MAEQAEVDPVQGVEEDDEKPSNYKPPAEKSVKEILQADAEDESLRKYKESLGLKQDVVVDPNDPRRVIIKKLVLLVEGRPDVEIDLTGDLKSLKGKSFTLKEGCQYRIKICFIVQREIVSGLKYKQKSYRKGINVDKTEHMVGSRGPKHEEQQFISPVDEAPKGMLARGSYHVKSCFIDDDKYEHVNWEWQLEIKKDW